jgi:diaminohydroxyphosphoribosylaminopyrimidine deaminase / 5-amino-6-(5-phosphoribosylamino)uracil reductase
LRAVGSDAIAPSLLHPSACIHEIEARVSPEHPPQPDLLRKAAERALELGRSVAGTTGPNPPVGCVIVRGDRIVGEGATRPTGGPHAEVVALNDAGGLAEGATAVVTLEPCGHTGRTGPCSTALLEAGVAGVVYLLSDPHALAAGGARLLSAAGIDVMRGLPEMEDLTAAAARDLRGFLRVVSDGRPHVLLKLAQLPDGSTVPAPGSYLTGHAARARVHELRAEVDAVLVGGATIRVDDPRLDVRHHDVERQPRPVVLSASGDVPVGSNVVRRGAIVIVGTRAPDERVAALTAAGAAVLRCAERADGSLDIAAALGMLPDQRILTVLAEPGIALAASLLSADVVDVIELHVAGAAGLRGDALTAALALPAGRFHPSDQVAVGDDLVLRLERAAMFAMAG